MNRKERRAAGIKRTELVYNLRACDIATMKADAYEKAVRKSFFLMLAIPCMILHDKYAIVMRKEGRELRFAEECMKLYKLQEQGYVDIKDLHDCLKEETGLIVEDLEL